MKKLKKKLKQLQIEKLVEKFDDKINIMNNQRL